MIGTPPVMEIARVFRVDKSLHSLLHKGILRRFLQTVRKPLLAGYGVLESSAYKASNWAPVKPKRHPRSSVFHRAMN